MADVVILSKFMATNDTAKIIENLRKAINACLPNQADLHEEFDLLLKRSLEDPPMALARARRILEVLVMDQYINARKISPPFQKGIKNKKLYNLIEEVAKYQQTPRVFAALCHATRVEGNRSLHYSPNYPNEPRNVLVTDTTLGTILQKITEVAEIITTGSHSAFISSLAEPTATMYKKFHETWIPKLKKKQEGVFPLYEALELLFRSLAPQIHPEWFNLLVKYNDDGILPPSVSHTEENALRQLRNLSLIQHDGQWLFTPTRSTKIWLSASGHFMIALYGSNDSLNAEELARQVIRNLRKIEKNEQALSLLERIHNDGNISNEEKDLARQLRNLYLISHSTYFLEAKNKARLTDLGYYVFGRYNKDS